NTHLTFSASHSLTLRFMLFFRPPRCSAFTMTGAVSAFILILLPAALGPAAGFPTRAAFPADSAGAVRWSPRFAKRSNDAPPVAWSSKLLRIFVWQLAEHRWNVRSEEHTSELQSR